MNKLIAEQMLIFRLTGIILINQSVKKEYLLLEIA